MKTALQEPRSYHAKNGTENGRWDETQLAPVFGSVVFAFLTTFFIVDIDYVHYAWWLFIIGTTFILTLKSSDGSGMRTWQVYYNYLFSPKGDYNFIENKKIIEPKQVTKTESKEK